MEPRHNTNLGQHFLREPRIARRILDAAEVQPGHRVLEIGPGGGVLTEPLNDAVGPEGKVIAIEADRRFADRIKFPNVEVIHADALRIDLAELGPFDRIVSNLPYQISGPITAAFLDLHAKQPWGRAVLMFQKEFADRLIAPSGTKAYGRLSVHTARVAAATKVRDVPPGCFDPPPKVHSSVICLDPHETAPFHVAHEGLWRALIDGTFQSRRKQLRNTAVRAAAPFGLSKDAVLAALAADGLESERPEQVAPARFASLTGRLAEHL